MALAGPAQQGHAVGGEGELSFPDRAIREIRGDGVQILARCMLGDAVGGQIEHAPQGLLGMVPDQTEHGVGGA